MGKGKSEVRLIDLADEKTMIGIPQLEKERMEAAINAEEISKSSTTTTSASAEGGNTDKQSAEAPIESDSSGSRASPEQNEINAPENDENDDMDLESIEFDRIGPVMM